MEVASGEVVSDGKAIGGAAHQAPSPYKPRPAEPTPTEAQDPRVESAAVRQSRRTMRERSHIPAWIRQDRVRYHQEVASQNRPHASRDLRPDGLPWSTDLQTNQDRYGMKEGLGGDEVVFLGPNGKPYRSSGSTWSPPDTRPSDATMVDGGRRGPWL